MKFEKTTDSRGRGYGDACGMAFAMEIIGERWTLMILRELMYGARRFGQIRRALPGISASVLTQRLERLEALGLLVRSLLPPPASVQVYALTEWGCEIEPMMGALGRWAVRSPLHDPSLPLSETSLMMSLRTNFVPALAAGLDARIGFEIGSETFSAHLHDGSIDVMRGEAKDAVLHFAAAEAGSIAAALYGGVRLAELEESGAIAIKGDRALAERFVGLFPLPGKIG
jgi:DNA-binding HxlR family transcriptional regulator